MGDKVSDSYTFYGYRLIQGENWIKAFLFSGILDHGFTSIILYMGGFWQRRASSCFIISARCSFLFTSAKNPVCLPNSPTMPETVRFMSSNGPGRIELVNAGFSAGIAFSTVFTGVLNTNFLDQGARFRMIDFIDADRIYRPLTIGLASTFSKRISIAE